MDTTAPPGKKRSPGQTGLREKLTGLPGAYHRPGLVQSGMVGAARRCVVCASPVDNGNLGGHARHSALAGCLWCLSCSDGGQPQ
jgi:hypothetical protein